MNTTGIILKTLPYKESDLIVWAYSPDLGKFSVLARSARRSKKRFPGGLEPFDIGIFTLTNRKSGIANLESFSPEKGYHQLRADTNKLSCACVVLEVTDKLSQEDSSVYDDAYPIYSLLTHSLRSINQSTKLSEILKHTCLFISAFLDTSGFHDASVLSSPSPKILRKLLRDIENLIDKKLESSVLLESLLREHRQQSS